MRRLAGRGRPSAWSDASISQGMPGTAHKRHKPEEAKDSPLELSQGAWPCWHVNLGGDRDILSWYS